MEYLHCQGAGGGGAPGAAGHEDLAWRAGGVLRREAGAGAESTDHRRHDGEGEETFLELVRHYADGASGLSEIRGIAWRGGDGLIRDNGFRGPVDLDTVPFIYQDLSGFENRILYYESSRGCPFSCSYCLSSIDRKLRFRSMELVKRELQFFLDHKVPQVKFVDRTFNCSHQRALEIWRYLTEHDNGVTNFILRSRRICSMRRSWS